MAGRGRPLRSTDVGDGRGVSSQRHSREKRRIIDVATTLIAEQGLGHFKIEALAERLGYTRQNIYRYFPNKQAILNAVIIEGSRTMAVAIAQLQADYQEAPFDEQLIDGVLTACAMIRAEKSLGSYAGENLSAGIRLFMDNAVGVRETLQVFLEPLFEQAKQRGELYLNMSYDDITRWLFQVVVSELVVAQKESRAERKAFLLKMFSPSINAKKAGANATIDNVHSSHMR